MSTSKRSLSERLFGGRLRLLPFDFRDEFGSEMQEVFREQEAAVKVVRQGMWLVFLGMAVGLPCTYLLTGGLRTLLFQVAPTDALTFASVLVLLAGAALIACYLPARRAARIDPMVALRCD